MVAYVVEHKPPMDGPRERTGFVRYTLETWGGEFLAALERTDQGRWYSTMDGTRVKGGSIPALGSWLMAFRTANPIAGYHWYGRGLGAGCALKLRRGRKA